jgi:O-acetyl-ADP-ribose deacetylase (regulator of RNase III)
MPHVRILKADITTLRVDAIVNAANAGLLGGGGVDGAIHAAAGPQLLAACRALGGCATGAAKLTAGYRLPASYVIHAVGPIWQGGAQGEPELLAACYRASLALTLTHPIRTIAFAAISCGVYGFPIARAATIAVAEVARFMQAHPDQLDEVCLVAFGPDVESALRAALHASQAARPFR